MIVRVASRMAPPGLRRAAAPKIVCVIAMLGATLLLHAPPAKAQNRAAPQLKEMSGSDLAVQVVPDRIKWGEETDVVVSAVNSTGSTLPGGLYVSFDEDVLILDVKGGTLLRPGAQAFNLRTGLSKPIARPMVESWEHGWSPGTERRVILTVLPMARDRIRVLARVTLAKPGNPPLIHVSPGPAESRALDEAEFPARTGYIWVARHDGLRRALRRVERRIRNLDETDQRRFALALASAMGDPTALTDLLADAASPDLKQLTQALRTLAPRIAEQLRNDPIFALDNLRCLMANLGCKRALVYFGVPLSLYGEISREEAARLEAKKTISNERGGNELVALLETEGFSYRQEQPDGAIVVQVGAKSLRFTTRGSLVKEMLGQIVATIGPAAERVHEEANGLSFARLRAQLDGR